MKPILTLDEVAEYLRCSVMTVRRLIRTRQLQAIKVRGQWRIRATALEAYIQRNTLKAVGELDTMS